MTTPRQNQRNDLRVVVWLGLLVGSMTALSFAAVPLYQLFCQVTGYGGTTQRAEQAPAETLDRTVTVRFDANISPGLPWHFQPVSREITLKIGENRLASYRVTNLSGRASTGTATFNVTPEIAGSYFSKIECFCFQEQTLQPGESAELPVSFFVDPALVNDRDAAAVTEITLSYTFFPVRAGNVSNGRESAQNAAENASKPPLEFDGKGS